MSTFNTCKKKTNALKQEKKKANVLERKKKNGLYSQTTQSSKKILRNLHKSY